MTMRTQRTIVSLALVLALAPACSFLKPRADPTSYFVLTSEEPKAPAAAAPFVTGVDHIELPEYLMRPELVTRSASNKLAIAEYDRWGEPLKEGFARAFRRDLENQLGAGHVVAAPFDPASPPALSIDLEVRRFERVGDEAAVLEAGWTIRNGKSGATVARHDARVRAPLSGRDASATVAALSRALADLAAEIGAAVRAQPALR
ncbi:MAG: hypothetical protein JWM53_5478 [bacterium]|nr:hypothetical protein [bacterium]